MARKYYFQNFSTNGIVSYTTYKGDLAGFPLNEGKLSWSSMVCSNNVNFIRRDIQTIISAAADCPIFAMFYTGNRKSKRGLTEMRSLLFIHLMLPESLHV